MDFLTDSEKKIDFDKLRDERCARIQEILEKNDLDAILTFKHENTRYITGLKPLWFPIVRMRDAAVAIRGKPDPILFAGGGDADAKRQAMYWLKPENILPFPPLETKAIIDRFLPTFERTFRDLEIDKGRVGIDVVTPPVLEGLQSHLPKIEWVDGDEPLRRGRLVKTEEEVKCFRMACVGVDVGFDAALRSIRVGRRECEILGIALSAMYAMGMEIPQCASIVASGENLSPLAKTTGNRVIRYGDLVFLDMGGCFSGLFAEASRTVACGPPNARQKEIYRAVQLEMKAILGVMRPGVTNAQVFEAAMSSIRESGFEEYALRSVLGHSIGVGGWEPPTLGNPDVTGEVFELEKDMIFSIEPTIVVPEVPGGGSVRIEEEVLITENGCEVLTRAPVDERLHDMDR